MGAGACFLPLSTAHVLMIDKTASDDKKFTWVELCAALQRLTQNIVSNLIAHKVSKYWNITGYQTFYPLHDLNNFIVISNWW